MPERKKGKHLTLEERQLIQKGLREHRNFTEIAMMIGCSPDTISKEIRRHRYHQKHKSCGYLSTRITPNNCKYRYSCRHRNVCNKPPGRKCRIPCRKCLQCNKLCPFFVYEPCESRINRRMCVITASIRKVVFMTSTCTMPSMRTGNTAQN